MELRRKMGSARTAMLCAVLIWKRGSRIVQHAAGPWSCMAAAGHTDPVDQIDRWVIDLRCLPWLIDL